MATELRTLRVSAEMDSAKYVAGANQKVAADKAMSASSQAVGQAITQQDQKISQAGDVLSRLSRQYVDGYAAAQRMQQAVNSLSRGIDSGRISMAQAEPILEGIYRKYGQLGSGATFAAAGQAELAAAIDRTTAKMQAQTQVASRLPSGANDNEAMFRRRNLNYQLFDVSQGLALGMNPAMIAMQQGPQILQMYAGQGGVNAALKDTGTLVTSLATKFWPVALAAAAGSVAILQLQTDIETATGKSASFGQVASAAIKLIASDIYQYIKPAVEAISPWFDAAWEGVKTGSKEAINLFIAGWMIQIDALKTGVNAIPDAFIAAGEAAANGFLSAIQAMVREALVSINDLISDINGIMRQAGIDMALPFAPSPMSFSTGTVDIGGKAASDRLNSIWEDFKARSAKTFTTDFVGGYFQSLVDRISKDLSSAGLLPDGSPGRPIPIPQFRGVDDVPTPTPAFGAPVGWGTPQWQTDLRGDIKGFFSDFQAGLRNGEDFGEAFGKAILNGMNRALDRMLDKSINSLLDSFFGTGFQDGRGGGFLDGIIGRGAGVAANDNIASGIGAVTSAPLGGRSAYRDAIALIESAGSGDYSAIGPTHPTLGRALGRYQVMEANIGPWSKQALGRSIGADEFLRNPGLQDGIFDHKFGSYVDKFGERGAAQAWFGGEGSVGKLGRKDVLGTTVGGYGDKFMAALDKTSTSLDTLATKSIDATSGLGGFASALSGGKGGVGGFDWSSLFSPNFKESGGGFASLIGYGGSAGASASGGGSGIFGSLIGLLPKLFGFAGGTENAPDGWAWVGEQGPELKKLRAGDVIRSNPRSQQMAANSQSGAGRPQIALNVTVVGGSGDDHIRMLAKQGAQEAIGGYDQGLRQGGFGDMQNQYSRQKG